MIETDNAYVMRRCRELLDDNNLTDWKPFIDYLAGKGNSYRYRIGQCRHTTKEIGISRRWILATAEQRNWIDILDDLLLHEIAHALTPHANHTLVWQREYAWLLRERFSRRKAKEFIENCSYDKTSRNAERLMKEMDELLDGRISQQQVRDLLRQYADTEAAA